MSDAIFTLDATVRTDLGKGASRRLRHNGKVPGIIYGGGKDPVAITLDHNKLIQAQDFEAFYSHVLTINVDGKAEEALVKDMQRHAFKPKVTHIDFQRIVAGEKLTTNVPIHFINEDKNKAIQEDACHAEYQLNDIEIECLPKNLPEYIEVDLADLEVDTTLHLSDLTFPKGVESVELNKDDEERNLAVATIKAARLEEPEEDEAQSDSESADDSASEKDSGEESGDTEE